MSGDYEGQTAVLYARVSTDDKDQRPESQLGVMRDWCDSEGIVVVGEYVDELSGKDMARPQFQAVLGRIITGSISSVPADGDIDPLTCKVNLLVAWHQTRISRDQADFLNVKKLIEGHGCVIRFVSNLIRTETPEGQLITSIDAWHGQIEREKLSDNTRMGMRQRKLAGQYLSRPHPVVFKEDLHLYTMKGEVRFGDEDRYNTVVTTESDVYHWAAEGLSIGCIARDKLNVSRSAFRRLLIKTGRFDRFYEIYLSALSSRGVVLKGREKADLPVQKGGESDVSSRVPLKTGSEPLRTEEGGEPDERGPFDPLPRGEACARRGGAPLRVRGVPRSRRVPRPPQMEPLRLRP